MTSVQLSHAHSPLARLSSRYVNILSLIIFKNQTEVCFNLYPKMENELALKRKKNLYYYLTCLLPKRMKEIPTNYT